MLDAHPPGEPCRVEAAEKSGEPPLIELDEQLLFRCGGRPLVIIPHDPDPAAREVENKEGAAKGPPAKAAKAPDAEKKQTVPLKKAAAPPSNQPAKGAAKETPPVKTAPQPEAGLRLSSSRGCLGLRARPGCVL